MPARGVGWRLNRVSAPLLEAQRELCNVSGRVRTRTHHMSGAPSASLPHKALRKNPKQSAASASVASHDRSGSKSSSFALYTFCAVLSDCNYPWDASLLPVPSVKAVAVFIDD